MERVNTSDILSDNIEKNKIKKYIIYLVYRVSLAIFRGEQLNNLIEIVMFEYEVL